MPIPFQKVSYVDTNIVLFQNLLRMYIHVNPRARDMFKAKHGIVDGDLPEEFTDIVDLYLNQPIDDSDFEDFFLKFEVHYQHTGKKPKELYEMNPEVMRPVITNLIKSKRIQTLVDKRQGNILGKLIGFINDGFGLGNVPEDVKRSYKQKISAKRKEVKDMYEPLEVQMAIEWASITDAHPEFRARENLHELTASGVPERNQLRHERLPNISPNALAFYQQQTREREAAKAAEKAAGGANTGGGRRRRRRGYTKRRKGKRKQTRRK